MAVDGKIQLLMKTRGWVCYMILIFPTLFSDHKYENLLKKKNHTNNGIIFLMSSEHLGHFLRSIATQERHTT